MNLQGQLHLTDHTIEEASKAYWEGLCQHWGIERIYDCTPAAAKLIVTYSILQDRSLKKLVSFGRSYLCWDRKKFSQLCLYRFIDDKVQQNFIQVDTRGQLDFEGVVYQNPQEILSALTLTTQYVHRFISFNLESPLIGVLDQKFVSSCDLSYPPEYPPVLVHIAILNEDYATAAKILEHPFILNPKLPEEKNIRLGHIVEASALNAIIEGHSNFLDYLYARYSFLRKNTHLLAQAIRIKDVSIAEKVLKNCSQETIPKLLEEAFKMNLQDPDRKMFDWLIENSPKGMTLISSQSTPFFVAKIFEKYSLSGFQAYLDRFHLEISNEEFLKEIVKCSCDPVDYLNYLESCGYSLKALSSEDKASIIAQATACHDKSSLLSFLKKDCFQEGSSEFLSMALLKVIPSKEKVSLLLSLGATPKANHFEVLLKSISSSDRQEVFEMFLNYMDDSKQSKQTLSIASAFGKEAMEHVFQKFPELQKDVSFLTDLMGQMWKGSKVAADKLLSELLSSHEKPTVLELSDSEILSLPLEKEGMASTIGKTVSLDALIDVLLPRHQLDKISRILEQRPELIHSFWWKAIFSGYSDFEGKEWEKLAKKTFSPLEEKQRSELLAFSCCYSHLQLADLWLQCFRPSPETIFESFNYAVRGGNHEAVKILAKYDLLDVKNESDESLLHIATRNNAIEFCKLLIEEGLDPFLKDLQGQSCIMIAESHDYFTLCRIFEGEIWFEKMADQMGQDSVTNIEKQLFNGFLNSECLDVKRLIHLLMKRGKVFKAPCQELEIFMRTAATLIVRYPFPEIQREVQLIYGSAYKSYEIQQKNWALECEESYQQFFSQYQQKETLILEVMLKLARGLGPRQGYDEWRLGAQGSALVTAIRGRYFLFWKLAQKIFRLFLKDPKQYERELSFHHLGYQIIYQPNPLTVIPLSVLEVRKPFLKDKFNGTIHHTRAEEVKQAMPYFHDLFEEIKNFFPKNVMKPKEPPPEFKQKIALLFWLGSHLTMSSRGSSQYMLMIHRLLYNIHGYKTLPWDLNYIQPDCVAIMLPFSIFYNDYYAPGLLFDQFYSQLNPT